MHVPSLLNEGVPRCVSPVVVSLRPDLSRGDSSPGYASPVPLVWIGRCQHACGAPLPNNPWYCVSKIHDPSISQEVCRCVDCSSIGLRWLGARNDRVDLLCSLQLPQHI